jgi:acetyltransferase-like isoleucine patch superfamily enzyme/acyl carrier protein
MAWRERLYEALLHTWSRATLESTLRRLRKERCFADEPNFMGDPHLEIHGELRVGRSFELRSQPVQTHLVVHSGARLEIGDQVSIGAGSGVAAHSCISIGDHTQCGSYVMILDSDYHVAGDPSAAAVPAPIHIGRGVRIGSHVTILRGSRIEDEARIAPGSVVSGLVPRGAAVGGVPARESLDRVEDTSLHGISVGVLRVAQQAFRLPASPNLSDGPQQIGRWDSLGALSFLLALEGSFSINLNVDEAAQVRSLADVVDLVQRTQQGQRQQADAADQQTRNPARRNSEIRVRVPVPGASDAWKIG